MPAMLNVAANLALGGSLAWVTRESPGFRREVASWVLLMLVGFEMVVVTPVTAFLFRFYPQWSMLYWFDPQIFPQLENWIGTLSAAVVLANLLAALIGLFITRWGILRADIRLCYAPWAVAGLTALLLLVFFGDRVLYVGDYDTFWQGNADLFIKRVAGWVGISLYLAGGAFVWWIRTRFADHDPSLV